MAWEIRNSAWNFEIDEKTIPMLCINKNKKYPKSQIMLTQKKAQMILDYLELIKQFVDDPQSVIDELQAKEEQRRSEYSKPQSAIKGEDEPPEGADSQEGF